jgi:hypothetical protein
MDEKQLIWKMVNAYVLEGSVQDGETKLVRVQDHKTTFVEPNSSGGQSIMMKEYQVDGKICWAGYSARSQTVYLSLPS